MEFFEISGPITLRGSVRLCGAKNSILPLLSASLLTNGTSVFRSVPNLTDVSLACAILSELGIRHSWTNDTITINGAKPSAADIPRDLMTGMRGSFVFLGSLLARNGHATLYTPGGCQLGTRPIDIHIDALSALGAQFRLSHDRLDVTVPQKRLRGTEIVLRFPSVGATENVLLAAATAAGTTTLVNAAREPEIVDLARYLNACGANITGAGQHTIVIEGVEALHGTDYTVVSDRILAATYIAAAATTKSKITIENVCESDLQAIVRVFQCAGISFLFEGTSMHVDATGDIRRISRVTCAPHPAFPTDAGPLLAGVLCFANGKSEIYDTVFENRFRCWQEMRKLGADAVALERSMIINKVCKPFRGAHVTAGDLRGGAALVCMALACEGKTTLFGVEHIDRGYGAIEQALSRLGAQIERKSI